MLIGYLVRNRQELCDRPDEMVSTLRWKLRRLSFFTLPAFFILMLIASIFKLSQYYVLGSMMVYGVVVGRLKKRWYPERRRDDLTLRSFFRKPVLKPAAKRIHE